MNAQNFALLRSRLLWRRMINVPHHATVKTQLTFTLCLCSLLAGGSLASAADIRQGLVAYWQMDALNGVNVVDATPFSNHMRAVNITGANFVAGQFGNAVSFNGAATSSTYLTNLHGPDPAISGLPIYRAGSYTITMWVKGPAQTNKYLYTEGSTTSNNPLLILQTGTGVGTNKLDVIIRNDANTALINHLTSSTVIFDNNWHHIAWVDDRGSVKLYVDGNLDAANFNYTPTGTFTFNTSAIGTLIRAAIATGNVFFGLIDDVALWKRPLSQSEVQQIRTNSIATPIPTFPPFFVTEPRGSTNRVGDRVTLSAVVEGGTPISLQWLKDGAIIPGATSNAFSISNLVASDSAGYSLYASNAFGTLTSSVATVLVIPDAAPDLRSAILSWWSMDDITGDENDKGITLDPYGHNDMRTVGPGDFLDLVPGMFINAIQFNGNNQYCLRTRGFPTYNNPSYTIAFWVNASASQSDRRIFAESHTNNTNSVISFGTQTNAANGTLRVLIRNDVGLTLLDRSSTRTVLDDNWHHVVWTETNNEVRLFIDGVLDETSFSYPRGGLSLNATTVGALVNALGAANFLNGLVDEVAVWGRALSYTEVQILRTNTVPEPLADSAPIVTGPPASQSVFTHARVTFSFAASGTGPLSWNWRREGTNLPGQTNATLVLSNLTLADAGNYDVVVINPTNALGSATSQVAVLTVVPIDLKVDVNNLGVDNTPATTEPGFSPFVLDVTAVNTPGPVTRVFNGAEVTISSVGGINMQSRKRPQPVNTGAFTEERLLQDFIFAADSSLGQGLDVAIDFLGANQPYTLTIWSFDNLNNSRFSDWSANSTTLTNGYTFTGSTQPTDNASSQFTRNVTADSNGRILIQARRGASATAANNVFLNALRLTPAPVAPEIRVLGIQLTTTNTLRLTISGINPGATHRIEQKTIVTDAWVNVLEAVFSAPSGNTIEAIIPVPNTDTRFYHVVEEP
jgi:hypothetical protein